MKGILPDFEPLNNWLSSLDDVQFCQQRALQGLLKSVDELIAGQKELVEAHNKAVRVLEARIESLESTRIFFPPHAIITDV